MKVLKARLYDMKQKEQQAKLEQIGGAKKDIAFGSQIRSYVLQPYQMIKDHRTKLQVGDVQRVLDGDIDQFIKTYLMQKASGTLGTGRRRRDDDVIRNHGASTWRSANLNGRELQSAIRADLCDSHAAAASGWVPEMNASLIAPASSVGDRSGRAIDRQEDDVARRLRTSAGSCDRRAARCTCRMKSIQIGSAVTAPVSPLPIGFFSS